MSEEYTPTCKDCQLRFSGRCSQLSDDPCNSFLFHQTIDAEEKKTGHLTATQPHLD